MTKQNHCEFDICDQKCKRRWFRKPEHKGLNKLCNQPGFFKCNVNFKLTGRDKQEVKHAAGHVLGTAEYNNKKCNPLLEGFTELMQTTYIPTQYTDEKMTQVLPTHKPRQTHGHQAEVTINNRKFNNNAFGSSA
jgi:hypothetical protein